MCVRNTVYLSPCFECVCVCVYVHRSFIHLPNTLYIARIVKRPCSSRPSNGQRLSVRAARGTPNFILSTFALGLALAGLACDGP